MRVPSRLTLLVLALAGLAAASPPARAGEFPDDWYYTGAARVRELEGKPAPPLDLGRWYTPQADLRGKILVVDFWGTWCGPCVAAIPHNVEIMDRYAQRGVLVLGVHDSKRGVDAIQQVIRDKKVNYPVALDRDGASTKAWKVPFWPTYAVVDTRGIVRAIGLKPGSVDGVLDRVLQQPEAPASPDPAAPPEVSQADRELAWLEGDAKDRRRYETLSREGKPPALRPAEWVAGDAVELDALAGRVVLISFWTPGKPECLKALAALSAMHEKLAEQGLVIIAMASTSDGADVKRLTEQRSLPYRVAIDLKRATARHYRVNDYPDTFLVDRAGRLRLADVREDALDQAVAHLLAEAPPKPEDPEAPARPPAGG